MNLIADIGNTLLKLYLFEAGEIIDKQHTDAEPVGFIKDFICHHPQTRRVIISSVRNTVQPDMFNDIRRISVLFFNHHLILPVKILYKTPETLGKDRLAAIIGAQMLFPGQNVLVFDAGTALTIDFIDAQGQYHGGNISPGLEMRFKALNHFTKGLPLEKISNDFLLTGDSTSQAIIGGVQNGIIFEVDAYIDQYRKLFKDIKIVFTGGDAIFFDKKLKNTIFVDSNLVAKGLNRILNLND